MKKVYTLILVCVLLHTNAQVGINTEKPDKSAVFDIVSTDKGVLYPRMTSAQRDAIQDPATGLMVYNISNNSLQVNIGNSVKPKWKKLNDGSLEGTLTCSSIEVLGDYYINRPLNESNRLKVQLNVINRDDTNYVITSNEVNSVHYEKEHYTFTSNGESEDIFIAGIGTPTQAGTFDYKLMFNENSCDFTVEVSSGTPPLQIGYGIDESSVMPIRHSTKKSLAESIYPVSELGTAQTINSIAFNKISGTDSEQSNAVTKIYMKQTPDNEFTQTRGVDLSTYTLVWTGSFPSGTGWNEITLDTAFNYNGTSNLIIAVFDEKPSYDYNSDVKYQSTNDENNYRTRTWSSTYSDLSSSSYLSRNRHFSNVRINP